MENRSCSWSAGMLCRLILVLTTMVLLLTGCVLPDRDAPPPVEETIATPEPIPTPTSPPPVLVTANANVRTGPGTDHPVAYWLIAGDEVTVVGASAAGDWLQIEHQDRPGWIATTLVDFEAAPAEAESVPQEPAPESPAPMDEPTDVDEPETVAEPTEAVEPTPVPEPQTVTPDRVTATVTGTVVNLRSGPGTDHATDGQVRAGDQLHVTGRNAAGDWLQVMHPVATGELVWIYGPLTDIEAATMQTLADASPVETEVAAVPAPTPQPVAPTPEPAPESALQTPSAAPVPPADCTRLHTVNPNETRLQQITDWFGLDLATTAELNGLSPDAPLTAGWQICLETGVLETAGVVATAADVELIPLPNHPDRAIKAAPAGTPILYHAPGSYSRDLPGLDYDFKLVFTDNAIQWDWRVRDFQGCYDALRVHMGTAPAETGLTRLEFQLSDRVVYTGLWRRMVDAGWEPGQANQFFLPFIDTPVPWEAWPNLEGLVPADAAMMDTDCYYRDTNADPPTRELFCDLSPSWGNSGSMHLDAVTIRAGVLTAGGSLSRDALYFQASSQRVPYLPYLFPTVDDGSGNPAGPGPCVALTRVR